MWSNNGTLNGATSPVVLQFYHMSTSAIDIFSKLHDIISQPLLFAVFGLVCVVFGLSSFVLLFHWDRYAIDRSKIVTAQMIYFLGGALILLIGFISVILY